LGIGREGKKERGMEGRRGWKGRGREEKGGREGCVRKLISHQWAPPGNPKLNYTISVTSEQFVCKAEAPVFFQKYVSANSSPTNDYCLSMRQKGISIRFHFFYITNSCVLCCILMLSFIEYMESNHR